MARIAGIDLPREKRVEIGLTYIYGIGRDNCPIPLLAATGVNPDTRRSAISPRMRWASCVITSIKT